MRRFVSSRRALAAVPLAVLAAGVVSARGDEKPRPAAGARQVSYLREVRPILAQHCFQCHGPDEAARKAKLRLDLKDKAFAERHGSRVIKPGDPGHSLVWERVASEDDDTRMPPPGQGEPLTAKQLDTLKTWIEQGAKWE